MATYLVMNTFLSLIFLSLRAPNFFEISLVGPRSSQIKANIEIEQMNGSRDGQKNTHLHAFYTPCV